MYLLETLSLFIAFHFYTIQNMFKILTYIYKRPISLTSEDDLLIFVHA